MPSIILNENVCTVCQTCIDTCPMGVFEFDGEKVLITQEDQCIECRACEAACPVSAIVVES